MVKKSKTQIINSKPRIIFVEPRGPRGKVSHEDDLTLTQISRISRRALVALVLVIRMNTLGKADKRGQSDALSVRFVGSV